MFGTSIANVKHKKIYKNKKIKTTLCSLIAAHHVRNGYPNDLNKFLFELVV